MTAFPFVPNHMRHPPQGLGKLWKSTFFFGGKNLTPLFGGRNSTNWLFSNLKILSPRFQCMTSFTTPGPISDLDFYFDISEWHVLSTHAWAPALMLHQTNPCTKWKVLSLTKLKGKIYKTKSLGHYITILLDYVNSIQPSIQFPMEREKNNRLSFLDVLLIRWEQGFKSSVYQKPTLTGQYLNFNFHHPYICKERNHSLLTTLSKSH